MGQVKFLARCTPDLRLEKKKYFWYISCHSQANWVYLSDPDGNLMLVLLTSTSGNKWNRYFLSKITAGE